MKKILLAAALLLLFPAWSAAQKKGYDPYVALEFKMGGPVKFFRATPIELGKGKKGFALLFSEETNLDPFEGSFRFPKDTPKLAVVNDKGEELWRRELPLTIPGTWFLPLCPMDMDGDGQDELYYVANIGELPFNYDTYKLERADVLTGKVTGQWDWPSPTHNQANSYKWRFFILGGHADGQPVLVTTQGTYRDMRLQGWNKEMKQIWKVYYPDDFKGSRGSHSTPILDMDRNGRQQFMYGERCIGFADGKELFVLDGDVWGDHSDTVLPFYDAKKGTWNFFTTREKGDEGKLPRSVTFNRDGRHLWEIPDLLGHYHYGWVGDFGPEGERIAYAGRYPFKNENLPAKSSVGKAYDAYTGAEVAISVPETGTVVDFNGDGRHEMFNNGVLYDQQGREVFSAKGKCNMVIAKKILDLPGEQVMLCFPTGRIQIWADRNAQESKEMKARFADPVYRDNVRLSACGYNNRFPILNY